MDSKIIVQADKTVVKITGLEIKGLNICQLEEILEDRIKGTVRIIGVTGNYIEMDMYDIEEDRILKDENGIIKAIALADGITLTDLARLDSVKKIKTVDFNNIPEYVEAGCQKERWL